MKFFDLDVVGIDGRKSESYKGIRTVNVNFIIELRYDANEVVVSYGEDCAVYEVTDKCMGKIYGQTDQVDNYD